MSLTMQRLTMIMDQGLIMPRIDNEVCDMDMKLIMQRLKMVVDQRLIKQRVDYDYDKVDSDHELGI